MAALARRTFVIGVVLVAIIGSIVYLKLRAQEEVHVPEFETIIILHTNDSHGCLLPEGNLGGFAYIASIVNNEREQNSGRVLLLDAGDIVDGCPIGSMFYGRSVITVMNAMGYDAMTLGNHDVAKYGIKEGQGVIPIENDYLMDLKENAEFPLLVANVLINGSKPFPSYVIEEVGGVRIGIIGVTTQWNPPSENVEILDPVTTANECVEEIEDNVDFIIALTHLGLWADEQFASVVKGVDIIIGGHSHDIMWEPENVGGTMIVQAGYRGKYIGRIQLEYDVKNHEIANFSYELIEVFNPLLEEDEEIAELVEYYENIISPLIPGG